MQNTSAKTNIDRLASTRAILYTYMMGIVKGAVIKENGITSIQIWINYELLARMQIYDKGYFPKKKKKVIII